MTSSKEHEGIVRFICKKLNLEPIIIKGNHTIKGKYFPDAIIKQLIMKLKQFQEKIIQKEKKKNGIKQGRKF